jgi:hypothetical protein
MGLLALVLALVLTMNRGAARSGEKTVEHSAAVRAAMMALETIQRDVDLMLYQCPERDLVLLTQAELGPGRGLCVHIPAETGATGDPWRARHVPIAYTLRKAPGSKKGFHLVRIERSTGRETVYKSALLADLKVEWMPRGTTAGGLVLSQDALTVTCTGMGASSGEIRYTAAMLLPLPRMGLPEKFPEGT